MKWFEFKTRKLYFVSYEEVAHGDFQKDKHTILITTSSEEITPIEKSYLESFLSSNCTEIYCVGTAAEKTHDIVDEIIEEKGFFEILTTWVSDESLEDISFYFLNVAGSKPSTLLAITNGDTVLEKALKQCALSDT
jgi:hypothetical protein